MKIISSITDEDIACSHWQLENYFFSAAAFQPARYEASSFCRLQENANLLECEKRRKVMIAELKRRAQPYQRRGLLECDGCINLTVTAERKRSLEETSSTPGTEFPNGHNGSSRKQGRNCVHAPTLVRFGCASTPRAELGKN